MRGRLRRTEGSLQPSTMGLPPTSMLLQPPRRSADPTEWSKAYGQRPCLTNIPRRRPGPPPRQRLLSPLKCSPRGAFPIQPMCVMPKRDRSEDFYNQPSFAPIPLKARELRYLAVQKAERAKAERMIHEDLPKVLQKIVMPAGTHYAQQREERDDVVSSLTPKRARRFTVDGTAHRFLPPIEITMSKPVQRPHSSPVPVSPGRASTLKTFSRETVQNIV